MNYRKEIDGLRAIAVVPVILFHAGFGIFSGGFVGVDIFFVISGYLITGIIFGEISSSKFSLVHFYERRFRRIAPAFTVVLLFCMVASWRFLLPNELVSFYKSVMYACAFSANIFFRGQSGYFDISSDLKPLLHVWSLSVEEQFYLLFPVVFLLVSRFGRRTILAFLSAIFIVSFYYAETRISTRPEAAFFLLKFRAWELALGALISVYFLNFDRGTLRRSTKEALCWIGFSLIAIAVFYFSNLTPFPGFWALIPTLGSALIIILADDATYFGRIIGSKYFREIGTSSYGAYLWHNPLFVFCRYYYNNDPSYFVMCLMVILSFVLGFLSAVVIEKPCRSSKRISFGVLAPSVCVPVLFFVGFSALGISKNGFYERYSREEVALLQMGDVSYKESLKSYDLGGCFIDYDQNFDALLKKSCVSDSPKERVIVFGDSEAAHWMTGVRKIFESEEFFVQQWTATSCRAVDYASNTTRCKDFYRHFVQNIVPRFKATDTIIVGSRWVGVLNSEGPSSFTNSVRSVFDALKKSKARIVIIGNTPEFPLTPQHLMVRGGIRNVGDVYLKTDEVAQVNQIVAREALSYGFEFDDPTDYLCKKDDNRYCLVASDGVFYFFDSGHLSPSGSEYLFRKFAISQTVR